MFFDIWNSFVIKFHANSIATSLKYSPKEKFVSQSKDAFILKKKIQGKNIKYIIVDDYRLNKNWEKHFYHDKFASSAHPNFLNNHANKFLQFLDRNCDEIQDFRENNDKGYLNINIKLIKERYDTTTTNIVVPIN